MGQLQAFLLEQGDMAPVSVEIMLAPFPFPFVVQSITEAENKQIRQSCQKTFFDKKSGKKIVETNADLYNSRLVAACCLEPNFKDAALQTKYGVLGAEALIDALLNPGQYTNLLLTVQDINGFSQDINLLRDEAKN